MSMHAIDTTAMMTIHCATEKLVSDGRYPHTLETHGYTPRENMCSHVSGFERASMVSTSAMMPGTSHHSRRSSRRQLALSASFLVVLSCVCSMLSS